MDRTSTISTAIDVEGLVKRYDGVVAVDGLDLRVQVGAFYGLLGPNGAGKTTTLSVLTTLSRATAGRVEVLGRDVATAPAAARRDLGLVFQSSCLDLELTAREHLDLQARLYRVPDRRARIAELLAVAGLESDADRPVKGFSGGMKRRLEIARGVLHRPRLLFLDEPTLGLDVAARAQIWDHLRKLHAAGPTTIFLTTHSMEEADALCERIGILDRGRLVAEGTPEALKAALGGDVVRLVLATPGEVAATLREVEGVESVVGDEAEPGGHAETWRITVREGPRRLAAIVEAARPFGIVEVTLHRPTLEHVFLHHTGHAFEPDEVAR